MSAICSKWRNADKEEICRCRVVCRSCWGSQTGTYSSATAESCGKPSHKVWFHMNSAWDLRGSMSKTKNHGSKCPQLTWNKNEQNGLRARNHRNQPKNSNNGKRIGIPWNPWFSGVLARPWSCSHTAHGTGQLGFGLTLLARRPGKIFTCYGYWILYVCLFFFGYQNRFLVSLVSCLSAWPSTCTSYFVHQSSGSTLSPDGEK